MKTNYNKKSQTFSLTGLSAAEYAALGAVLITANTRCFEVRDKEDGTWYSNSDFVCTLGDDERAALRTVCKGL
jgi:hypothetical protein